MEGDLDNDKDPQVQPETPIVVEEWELEIVGEVLIVLERVDSIFF